jgi:hypothetical protein
MVSTRLCGKEDAASVVAAARGLQDRRAHAVEEALQHRIPRRVDDDESRHGNTGGVERASLVPLVDGESKGARTRSDHDAAGFEHRDLIEVNQFVIEGDDVDVGGEFVE